MLRDLPGEQILTDASEATNLRATRRTSLKVLLDDAPLGGVALVVDVTYQSFSLFTHKPQPSVSLRSAFPRRAAQYRFLSLLAFKPATKYR